MRGGGAAGAVTFAAGRYGWGWWLVLADGLGVGGARVGAEHGVEAAEVGWGSGGGGGVFGGAAKEEVHLMETGRLCLELCLGVFWAMTSGGDGRI